MGITIHWQGQLRDQAKRDAVVDAVREFANKQRWRTYEIPLEWREVIHVVKRKVVTRTVPTSGIGVRPHRACEHVIFEFDPDGRAQGSCKTQYAGADIHISVIELLKLLAPHFREFKVHDEGGYWESQDVRILIAKLEELDLALSAVATRLEAAGSEVEDAPWSDGPKAIH